jgi:small subunit ribosomal protein S2
MSFEVSMKSLLESGVHFGHRTNRWDPRMRPFIFTERNGIHIIDLQQTVRHLEKAYNTIRDKVADGGTILFVGTKRQAQETIQFEAERCEMPYVTERWLPGTLTNWVTIYQRIMELDKLEKLRDSGEIDRLIKKEGLMIERKINRLLVHLSGIRHMNGLPDMLFIVDVMREDTAVHEANLKNIPVVALVDTNCNPNGVDYVIPANDDAIRAIKLLVSVAADAVIEGKSMRKEEDLMETSHAPIAEGDMRERSRGKIALEEDVQDEELLGTAVLQKLASSRQEVEPGESVEAVSDEVKEEPAPTPAVKKPAAPPIIKADLDEEEEEELIEDLLDADDEVDEA